jgi:hypothetical protein
MMLYYCDLSSNGKCLAIEKQSTEQQQQQQQQQQLVLLSPHFICCDACSQ